MAAKEIRRAKLRERMFGDRAFYAEMISVVVPIIIQNTVSNVVSLLDNVMVGRVGTLQMSAVAIVNQLLFVFNLCIFGGLAGAGIFATQYAGAHDHKGVRDCFRVKWMISVSMLACALAVFIALPKQLIGMYLAEETAQADAAATLGFGMDYLTVMLWGLLPFGVTQVYASTLREVGETRLPMLASVAAILVNLVFNYFLIFGKCGFPEMGVTGAAIATVIGQVVSCTVGFVLNQWKNRELRLTHEDFRFDWKTVQNILVVGIPSTIMQAISSVCTTLMNMILAGFGDIYVNVLGVYFKLQSFVFMPVFGLCNGMVPIVGYNFGAQKKKRVYECVRVCLVYALVIMAVGALLFLAVPNLLMMPFDSSADKALTAEGCVALRIICSHFLIAAAGITLSTVFQAVGRGTYSLIMSLCRQLIVLLPATWALSLIGPNAIWWAFPIAEIVSLTICLLLYRKCDRELIAPLPEE